MFTDKVVDLDFSLLKQHEFQGPQHLRLSLREEEEALGSQEALPRLCEQKALSEDHLSFFSYTVFATKPGMLWINLFVLVIDG